MKNLKIKMILASLAAIFLVGLLPAPATAQTVKESIKCGVNQAAGERCDDNTNAARSLSGTIADILNVFSAVIGVIAVIMILIAGFRFVTSGGGEQGVKNARSTILYAVAGLVVVALAQVIVQFVLKNVT